VGGPNLNGNETFKGFSSAILFVGEKGKLIADYSRLQLLPDEFAKDFQPPAKSIPASIGHHKEWCEAIKSGGTTTCHFEYAGRLAEAVLLGNVAYRAGLAIKCDSKEATTGSRLGDGLLSREFRKGWELPT